MGKIYSADQWRAWISEFEESPLTVEKFCKSIGASVQTFYKWRRKLKDEPGIGSMNSSSTRFVPVSLASSAGRPKPATSSTRLALVTTATLEIEFPGGVFVRVANDADSLRPLFELLREWGTNQ